LLKAAKITGLRQRGDLKMQDLLHFLTSARLAAALVCSLALSATSRAQAQQSADEFYRGKIINLYVGFAPGGSYDYYARLYGRFMGRYIPGHPTIVTQTMLGGGSLQAANYLYAVAPKDGTALGVVTQTLMLEEAMLTPGVRYKATELTWIGRMTAVLETVIISQDAKAKTIYDVRQYETNMAGTGSGSPSEGYPRLLNAFAATKFKVISGYPGASNAMMALENGEIDAVQVSWNTIVRTKQDWVQNHRINVLVQATPERSSELPDVPTLVELGNTPDDRKALAFYTSAAAVGRAMIATPGIPADRVKALRDAFNATQKDPDFLAEIEKSQSELNPASGEYLQQLTQTVVATPPDIVRRTSAALHSR
jgi:tripartite-type tricarboxylate transporter receptor subunit TctC